MKIIGVIPARYESTRFPGKPLANICGKPMIWWVYQQCVKVEELTEVYVATDDKRIEDVCNKYGLNVVMTRNNHPDHISRVQEVSDKIVADYYICVNGDEPLIDVSSIRKIVVSNTKYKTEDLFFGGAYRNLTDPAETIDSGNIKIVLGDAGNCMYMSRTPIPFPKGTLMFKYKKYVGIECFNKKALDFFVSKSQGQMEKVEDIDHIRFLENGQTIKFSEVESESISVDTQKDLEKVKLLISEKIKNGELVNE
ncbi:MAG: 3-deoxy-manno-octulosonate cytidylyltransferase [Bacillota bacterium]